MNGVMILSLFAGAVALASYVPSWRVFEGGLASIPRIIAASEAAAVSPYSQCIMPNIVLINLVLLAFISALFWERKFL